MSRERKYLPVDVKRLFEQAQDRFPGLTELSVDQITEIEPVAAQTVRNASSAGELAGVGWGKSRRYPVEEVVNWQVNRRKRSMERFARAS